MVDGVADPIGTTLSRIVANLDSPRVVDLGGGSGSRAVPLARAGCDVLVVDASTDALASLMRRAAEAGVADRVSSLQADAEDIDSVVAPASADLVLHHRLVGGVDDPAQSVAAAAALLRPGGVLSVVAPGRLSAVLRAALSGEVHRAEELLDGQAAVDRFYDVASLGALLIAAGVEVTAVVGVGIVTALSGERLSVAQDASLADLEQRLTDHPVLGQVAGELHALGRRG